MGSLGVDVFSSRWSNHALLLQPRISICAIDLDVNVDVKL
jgi:hypothetical protein